MDFAELARRLEQAEQSLDDNGERQRKTILDERARAAAADRDETVEIVDPFQLFAFRIGPERFAIPLELVAQVVTARGLSRLAGAPQHVLGTVVTRARAVTVLDLRALLELRAIRFADLATVVVVTTPGGLVGLAAEEVEGVLEVSRQRIAAAPRGPFLGLSPDGLVLIDIPKLLERR